MTIRLDKLNRPNQIERIIRDWIARDKEILSIDIAEGGHKIKITYRQNSAEVGFITMEVGIERCQKRKQN